MHNTLQNLQHRTQVSERVESREQRGGGGLLRRIVRLILFHFTVLHYRIPCDRFFSLVQIFARAHRRTTYVEDKYTRTVMSHFSQRRFLYRMGIFCVEVKFKFCQYKSY